MDGTPDVALPSAPEAAARARRYLERVGRDWPGDLLDLALLLTSEVVTNAVRYGRGRVTLTIHATAGRVRIEVGDENPAPVERLHHESPQVAEGGRGLHILDALATRWGSTARSEPPGKLVWFELELPR